MAGDVAVHETLFVGCRKTLGGLSAMRRISLSRAVMLIEFVLERDAVDKCIADMADWVVLTAASNDVLVGYGGYRLCSRVKRLRAVALAA